MYQYSLTWFINLYLQVSYTYIGYVPVLTHLVIYPYSQVSFEYWYMFMQCNI